MKKLPNIYKGNVKIKKNNREYYDSLEKDKVISTSNLDSKYDNLNVVEKIQELINQKSYIFNTKVILVYDSHEEECEIAGVVNNHIITMDNKIIKIDDLKDIKIFSK